MLRLTLLSLAAASAIVAAQHNHPDQHHKRAVANHGQQADMEVRAANATVPTDRILKKKKRATGSCSSKAATSSDAAASPTAVQANAAATSSKAASTNTTSSSSSSNGWSLVHSSSGSSFFDEWTFWNYEDPTHGTVTYVDSATAWSQGLASINSAGNAVMSVDNTKVVTGGRKSVRIHHTYVYTGGLVILDAVHMPTGCGTWPAFWSNGPNWPAGGEIDILEGTNDWTMNQVSVHTSPGCTIPTNYGGTAALTTGSYNSYDCSSANTANQGCGQRASSTNNAYGPGFNSNGGGVYAMKWDSTGIKVYFFPRSGIPSDITSGNPNPSGWGTPMGSFPSTTCDPYKFFSDHFQIFDTTFCGDWAGNVWNYGNIAGQSQSCAAITGYATCADYVLNEGGKFTEAYWEVKSVKWYKQK